MGVLSPQWALTRIQMDDAGQSLHLSDSVVVLRSPPTRTRRALFGRHAAADGLRRIISSLAGFVPSPANLNPALTFTLALPSAMLYPNPNHINPRNLSSNPSFIPGPRKHYAGHSPAYARGACLSRCPAYARGACPARRRHTAAARLALVSPSPVVVTPPPLASPTGERRWSGRAPAL
jgi:hypothetical protein